MESKFNYFILFLWVIINYNSCQGKEHLEPNITPKKIVENKQMVASKFSGNFLGELNGSEILVSLLPENNSNKITGEFWMNNERATITAVESNSVVNGSITEDVSSKTYAIKMEFIAEKLHLSMTFPEYDNQSVTIILEKAISNNTTVKISSNKPINQDLVGTWRYTEVLNSGSGEYYASFSTDYFIQFKANGECITWTGTSAGGDANTTIDSSNASNLEQAKWYIKNNTIVFVNPASQKQVAIPYYSEKDRMMLKGSVNRVYQRIF
jgi:hypothetical protein